MTSQSNRKWKPQFHLLTLIVMMLAGSAVVLMNMGTPEITQIVLAEKNHLVHISLHQWPLGKERVFPHHPGRSFVRPQDTLEVVHRMDFFERRPLLVWNASICLAIVLCAGALAEFLGNRITRWNRDGRA